MDMDTNDNTTGQDGAEMELTLQEFCMRLSATDKRVELIGGFESYERRAGTVKATQSEFSSRFQAFATKPL